MHYLVGMAYTIFIGVKLFITRGSIGTFYNCDTSMQHNKRMLLNIVMIHNISYKEAGGCMCEYI